MSDFRRRADASSLAMDNPLLSGQDDDKYNKRQRWGIMSFNFVCFIALACATVWGVSRTILAFRPMLRTGWDDQDDPAPSASGLYHHTVMPMFEKFSGGGEIWEQKEKKKEKGETKLDHPAMHSEDEPNKETQKEKKKTMDGKVSESAKVVTKAKVKTQRTSVTKTGSSSSVSSPPSPLLTEIMSLEQELREIRKLGGRMDEHPKAPALIVKLQDLCRSYLIERYGQSPLTLTLSVKFPEYLSHLPNPNPNPSIPEDEHEHGHRERLLNVDLGPLDHVPYSVFLITEVARVFSRGAFHRNAGHVIQALVRESRKGMAFQEYSPEYPHIQYSMGYCGRPGGPGFYISMVDNTKNHGPGSQGSKTGEADGCFGRLADQESIEVAKQMLKYLKEGVGKSGFISSNNKWAFITSMVVGTKHQALKIEQ